MAGGRPTDYSFELALKICEDISNGSSLNEILLDVGIARSTFFKWKRENKEFSDLYINIAQDKGELCIEEIDQTIQDLREGLIDPSTANVIIQTLKWKAAKFYPKMFGESSKIDVTSNGQTINQDVTPISFVKNDKDK